MKKILIVVDYQNEFASEDGILYVNKGESIVDKIQSKIDSNKYASIIYTFDTHKKEEYEKSEEKKLFPIHCEYNKPNWELYKIKPKSNERFSEIISRRHENEIFQFIQIENEFFFTKNKFNIWIGNEMFPKFIENHFSNKEYEVEVVGLATDYCVKEAIKGFVDRNYKVSIDKEATRGIYNISTEKEIFEEFKKEKVSIIKEEKQRKKRVQNA